jgi:hypothetical protein
MTQGVEWLDAQEQRRKYPATFWSPSRSELAAICPGQYVKVCACDERFWVKVTAVVDGRLRGCVTSNLLRAPWRWGDEVEFETRHVFQIQAADLDEASWSVVYRIGPAV